MVKPAIIDCLESRQIAPPMIWVDDELIYSNVPAEGFSRSVSNDGSAHEFVLNQTAYLGASKAYEVGTRNLVYGVMTPLAPLRTALLGSVVTVAGGGLLLGAGTVIGPGFFVTPPLRPGQRRPEWA